MSQITLRIAKGSALTQSEMDDNLRNFINSASVDITTGQLSLFTSESSGAEKQIDVRPTWIGYSGSSTTGVASVTGSLLVTGDITAQQFNTEIISSSTIFESGSTIFGDDSNDTHRITGSLLITGSQTLTGSLNVSGQYSTTGIIESTGQSSKIRFHYNEFDDLPSATTYHGMFAHVHSTGSAYYAHGGNWVRIAQSASFATPIATLTAASASHETAINTLNAKTLVSSSDQIADEISGSFVEASSSFSTRITTAESELSNTLISSSDQISAEISGSFSATHLNSKVTGILSSSTQITALGYTLSTGGGLISGSQQIDDLGFLKNEGDSVVSSSTQVLSLLPTGTVSSSAQTILNLPTGTISSSAQLPSNIVSSSAQTIANLSGTDIISSSAQTIVNLPTGTISSSAQLPTGTVSGSVQIIAGLPTGTVSGSIQISASAAASGFGSGESAATGTVSSSAEGDSQGQVKLNGVNVDVNLMGSNDSPTFNNLTVAGDLTVTGTRTELQITQLNIEDKLISVASGSATSANADGGGFHISGSDVSMTWDDSNDRLFFNTGSFFSGSVEVSGDVTAFSTSDERLKNNVTPIGSAIEKINQIGGYEFDWNSNSEHSGHDVGVIAQEIEKVLPEVVVDRDNGYKAVRYDKIVALLINAIKEQQLQIEELKSKL